MRRLEITIRKPGHDGERQVILGRVASTVVAALVMVAIIATVIVAIVFGYLVIGLLLVALLIAFIAAVLRGAWHDFRR